MKQRMITGIIAGAGFISLLYVGGGWFSWLIFILAIIGYDEFLRMNKLGRLKLAGILGFAGILLLTAPWNFTSISNPISLEIIIWIALFGMFAVTVLSKNRTNLDQIALMLLGVVYIGFGFHYMTFTRLMDDGLYWSFFLFACIWITDSGAFFGGKWLGKHLLWPAISPKKTIEGAIAGLLCAMIVAVLFALFSPLELTVVKAVWLGAVIALASQLGDLIQSAYKRLRGVKDAGNLLPGHGGILDRCDSWLIVFPLVQLLGLIG